LVAVVFRRSPFVYVVRPAMTGETRDKELRMPHPVVQQALELATNPKQRAALARAAAELDWRPT
jgi:hypothetical protein